MNTFRRTEHSCNLPEKACIWNLLTVFFTLYAPRCLRKKSRFSTTCYPNPRWCPLLKDPAWRTLCRNKQVPLWCAVLLFGGMEDWQSLAPLPAVSIQTELTTHLAAPWYITAKEFPFSSPLIHPDSIPVMDQCCYGHGMNWSETQVYLVEGRKTPLLETHVKLNGVLRGQGGNKGHFNVFYHLLPEFLACFLHHQKIRCKA